MGLEGGSSSAPSLHGGLVFPRVAPTEDIWAGIIRFYSWGEGVDMSRAGVLSSTGSSRLVE